MTREQFDSRFAATSETTSGFDGATLTQINDAVFEQVKGIDPDLEDDTHQIVQTAFETEFNKF